MLVVDGPSNVHHERGTGAALNLTEPLPGGDDRPADHQATQREHETRTAGLALGESVDRSDHGFQRLVNLGYGYTPALGHAGIVHHRRLVEHSFLAHPVAGSPGIASQADARPALRVARSPSRFKPDEPLLPPDGCPRR